MGSLRINVPTMTDPAAKGGDDDDLYDLAPSAPSPVVGPQRPKRSASTEPVVLAYHGTPGGARKEFDERTLKDLHLPLVLLCGGIVIEVIAAFVRARNFGPAMRHVGVDLVIGTGLMLVGILLAARFRGIELGRFWTVVLKLAAITVAPFALVRLATPVLNFVPLGWSVGFLAEFVLYFALLGVLFDLDESDTWYCVWVIFLVRLAVYFLLLGVGWV
jgi:hypothetical protein